MKRPAAKLATMFSLVSLTLVSVFVVATGSAVASDDKCVIAVKGDSPTARACAKGGRPEAKKVMKDMVKAAKVKGAKFSCDGCHKDLDSFDLTKDAIEDYKKLQAASGMK